MFLDKTYQWVSDTVGVATPFRSHNLIEELKELLKDSIDVHCYNDFGLSVANTYAAVMVRAKKVQVTLNEIGGRVGNASLAKVVMIPHSLEGIKTNINTQYLVKTAKLIERLIDIKIPLNMPIVGDNAFSHESDIPAN